MINEKVLIICSRAATGTELCPMTIVVTMTTSIVPSQASSNIRGRPRQYAALDFSKDFSKKFFKGFFQQL